VDSSNVQAISTARARTGRSKVIALVNPGSETFLRTLRGTENVEYVEFGKRDLFCRAIAESDERIAAVLAEPKLEIDLVHRRFLRRAKDLASAEGAVLVWDETEAFGAREFDGAVLGAYGVNPDLICIRNKQGTEVKPL
jgi:glutamate-1-semialdehyde aminotransferase